MATPLESWSKVEVRSVIRFLTAKGLKPTEIHNEIKSVYGEKVMGKSQVYEWCSKFKAGHIDVGDNVHPGPRFSAKTEDNKGRVNELIQTDRRLKIREISESLDISKSTVHRIVFDELHYRKVSARWVPKELTADHKTQRVETCETLLNRCRTVTGAMNASGDLQQYDEAFLRSIITGDETWIHHITPETKRDSMVWKHPSSPPPKKFKVQPSVKKLMATVFWDAKGILLLDILEPGHTVNANRYCQTLDKLKEAVRRKRPGRLTSGVLLQHDNATPHTANATQDWIRRFGWEVLPHPPHSPDLAPSDYHLFGPMKRHLSGQRFTDDDDLVEAVKDWLKSLDEKFFREGIFSLIQRWNKCVQRDGDYIEK